MDPKSPASSRMTRTRVVEGGENEVWHADTVVVGLDANAVVVGLDTAAADAPVVRVGALLHLEQIPFNGSSATTLITLSTHQFQKKSAITSRRRSTRH